MQNYLFPHSVLAFDGFGFGLPVVLVDFLFGQLPLVTIVTLDGKVPCVHFIPDPNLSQ